MKFGDDLVKKHDLSFLKVNLNYKKKGRKINIYKNIYYIECNFYSIKILK